MHGSTRRSARRRLAAIVVTTRVHSSSISLKMSMSSRMPLMSSMSGTRLSVRSLISFSFSRISSFSLISYFSSLNHFVVTVTFLHDCRGNPVGDEAQAVRAERYGRRHEDAGGVDHRAGVAGPSSRMCGAAVVDVGGRVRLQPHDGIVRRVRRVVAVVRALREPVDLTALQREAAAAVDRRRAARDRRAPHRVW